MKKIIFAFLILTTTSCFGITETKKISLEQAILSALSTNPQMKMAILDVEKSKNDIKTADKLQNPTVGTFQNMGRAGEGDPHQIGVEYIVELLKRGKRKEVAKTKSQSMYDNQKFQEYNLVFEVKKAYFDLLLKKSNLKILAEQKNISKEILDSTIKQEQKGKVPKTDVVQAKIAYNRTVMYYNIANSEVISSRNRFNSVMNTSNIEYDTQEEYLNGQFEELLTLKPTENFLNFENIKNYTLSNRYDLLSAQEEVKSAQSKLKVAKSQLIPDIELIGGYSYFTKGVSDNGRFQSGAFAGVNLVNIPLVYRYKPEINNAKLDIQKAQLKYEDLQIDVTRSISDAWEKYTVAKDNLNFYNTELLANSKELLQASIQSLDKKEIDMTDFLVSKKLYLEMMLSYHVALSEYYTSYAELLKEMNVHNINEMNKETI
ncbi:MAG: TolC family protein [Candidatus Gastranaerophilales bacterium]|nr:TolC family protein [Candidatus Gastranaerophilales bacterium]